MKQYKRAVSLVLTLAMTLSLLSAGAWASAAERDAPPAASHTVLILDRSASMAGAPEAIQKETACRFVNAALGAEGEHDMAVLSMNGEEDATEACSMFTTDLDVLTECLNDTAAEGAGDVAQSLQAAADLLNTQKDGAVKNIVFCSNGLPTCGEAQAEGAYTEKDYEQYGYANAALTAAETIKDADITLYTLGFFQGLTGNNLTFAQRFMKDLASKGSYCEVTDPADVEFLFGSDQEEPSAMPQNFRKTGCFYFPSFGGQDYAATFFYDDGYFTQSSYEYQDSLATMTLNLALSAFGTSRAPNTPEGYQHKSQNLAYLLEECGFPEEHYATNPSFREKPETDSIGVGASYKSIQDNGQTYTLIAAAVRGGGYESEWASNFTVGRSGDHQGFREARDQVLDFLSQYIKEQGITGDIKLWIGGYSRAAATTNLVAGALDDGYDLGDTVTLRPEDLYAYCYECPQGAGPEADVEAPRYQNIFNIVNPSDLVTKVAPTKPDQFGFRRFGVNCYLPTALKEGEDYNALRDAMLEKFDALPSTNGYVVDDFQMKKIAVDRLFWDPAGFFEEGIVVDNDDETWDMNAYLDETIYKLASENIRSRRNYVCCYEKDIREMCRALFGCSDCWDDFADLFVQELKDQSSRISACLILHMDRTLRRTVETALEDALHGAGITDYSARQIERFMLKVVGLLVPFGVSNPDLTVTAVDNLMAIGSAHLPEVCMAWLQSFDPNYTPEGRSAFNSGIHRVIRINSPVDVYVYDGDGTLTAAIVDGTSQEVDGSSIVTYINAEEEKLVYLPADEDYTVDLKASQDGTLTYSVQEYSEAAGGVNRIVNYYHLDTEDGETYTGFVPSINRAQMMRLDGTNTKYALQAPDGAIVAADENMVGAEAEAADCTVTAASNNESYGAVMGSDLVKVGSYVKLSAITNEGCCFLGWYAGDTLLSTEPEYRVCVTEDLTIEGRFAPADEASWEVDFSWTEDHSACTAVFTCGEVTAEVACTVEATTTPATTWTEGKTVYTASAEFQGKTYTDEQKEVTQRIPWTQAWAKWFRDLFAG